MPRRKRKVIRWADYFSVKGQRRIDETYAFGRYIPMSVYKARKVTEQILGYSFYDTHRLLEFMPYRACYPICRLFDSISANADHNKGFDKRNLVIVKAEVKRGPNMKKLKPRARGRSSLIKRPTCHINMIVRDITRFEAFNRWMLTLSIKDQRTAVFGMQYERFVITEPKKDPKRKVKKKGA
uniref:Large ribosomal subunit protein uL22c n=1 Tax=Mirabilis jalapa TaxID=3538 RepID=A0A411JT37_MIRJA|nr:ribosomal protein L22 [Mirabilis jalapa]QBC68225.1 ribosomal protein L22 [Mirabilis jalapa]QVL29763.1 ribosomal protein L22 [Mirabilis jalapa]